MAELFLKIVNMSISATWLVLAVLVLRFFLKKVPKWVSVLLWGIVAVRLLCPFSIESALSLIPSAETISPEIMYDQTPQITTGIHAINSVVNPILSESLAPAPSASANPLRIWIPVISVVWMIGMAVMILYTAVSYLRLRRSVRTATKLYDNLYQSAHIPSPFVLGIVNPKIYLPYGMNESDMSHVIAHEQTHIRRRDHWWKPLGFLLLTIHWFNPLMWVAYILLCRDIELACDEKVIKELGRNQRADYSQALLTCSVDRKMIAACPLAFGEVGVKERVKNVLSYKKPAFWVIVTALVVCVVVAVCFLTDPITSVRNPWIQEYVPGAEGIRGSVNTEKYESISEDFAIGADRYGRAVFKDPHKAFDTLLLLYADEIDLIQNEFHLPPLTHVTAELYKIYGWQTASNSSDASFVSSFLDIYENSFTKDIPPAIDVSPTTYITNIVDRTVTEQLPTDEAIEVFYEDAQYEYSFASIRSHLVMVTYSDGSTEDIKTALETGMAEISDLDRFGIHYYAEPKQTVMQPTETNLRGLVAGYLFTPIDGATYRYELSDPDPSNVTADQLLDTFTEETYIEGIVWEVYSLKEYPDRTKLLIISGTNGAWLCEYAPAKQAEEGALEAARAAGYVIEENGKLTDGKEAWEEFYEKTRCGEHASIYVAHYYTLDPDRTAPGTYEAYRQDYPALYIDELSYDGEKFVLRTEEDVRVYEYLMKYTGIDQAVSSMQGDEYTHYVLTHDNTVTWEQLWNGLISSIYGAYIDHYTICTELY